MFNDELSPLSAQKFSYYKCVTWAKCIPLKVRLRFKITFLGNGVLSASHLSADKAVYSQ